MLYKVVLTFESVDEILTTVTIQMKVAEQFFPVVLLIMKSLGVRLFCANVFKINFRRLIIKLLQVKGLLNLRLDK